MKEFLSGDPNQQVTLHIRKPITDLNNLTYDISYPESSDVKTWISRGGETTQDTETDPEDIEA